MGMTMTGGSQTSIRPTVTASRERVMAASPASPRGQPRSRLRTKMGARSCPTTLSHKSVESSPSSATASSTARRRKPPTISTKNFEPPTQPTPPPRRHKPSTLRLPHNKEEHNESAYHTHSKFHRPGGIEKAQPRPHDRIR